MQIYDFIGSLLEALFAFAWLGLFSVASDATYGVATDFASSTDFSSSSGPVDSRRLSAEFTFQALREVRLEQLRVGTPRGPYRQTREILGKSAIYWTARSAFLENHHAVGVGAVFVVFYTPAVGGFCKGVRVNKDFHRLEPSGFAAGEDMLLKVDFSVANFSDLDDGMACGSQDALDFSKGTGE